MPYATIVEDSSDPNTGLTATGTGTFTSVSFSPPANSLLVAMVAAEWAASASVTTIAVTDSSDSNATTWSGVFTDDTTGDGGASGVAYRYFPTAPGSMTVRSAYTNFSGGGRLMVIKVLTGAAANQVGASVQSPVAGGTDYSASITTIGSGSIVYGAASMNNNHASMTGNGSTTIILAHNNSTDNCGGAAFKSTNPTGTPGSATIGGTYSTGSGGSLTLLEVLPEFSAVQELATFTAVHRASTW
jgi:hypothetical protein